MAKTAIRGLVRVAVAAGVAAVALMNIGATDYDFAPVAKDDRAASVADCRGDAGAATTSCEGVSLPHTVTEAYMVMPGLTVVEQVAN